MQEILWLEQQAFVDFSSSLLNNHTFFLGRLLFLAFLIPELFLFFAWNLFFTFEFTCVFPGAMFFLRNILVQNRCSQGLLCHWSALTSGTSPESLPLHLRITCPAIFDLSSWNVQRFFNLISSFWRRSLIEVLWSGKHRSGRWYLLYLESLSSTVWR